MAQLKEDTGFSHVRLPWLEAMFRFSIDVVGGGGSQFVLVGQLIDCSAASGPHKATQTFLRFATSAGVATGCADEVLLPMRHTHVTSKRSIAQTELHPGGKGSYDIWDHERLIPQVSVFRCSPDWDSQIRITRLRSPD